MSGGGRVGAGPVSHAHAGGNGHRDIRSIDRGGQHQVRSPGFVQQRLDLGHVDLESEGGRILNAEAGGRHSLGNAHRKAGQLAGLAGVRSCDRRPGLLLRGDRACDQVADLFSEGVIPGQHLDTGIVDGDNHHLLDAEEV